MNEFELQLHWLLKEETQTLSRGVKSVSKNILGNVYLTTKVIQGMFPIFIFFGVGDTSCNF